MSTEWLLTAINTAFWDSLKNVEDKTREYENHVWYQIPSWNLWWRSEVPQIFVSAPVQSNARSGLHRTLHTMPDYTDYRWLSSWKRIALFQFFVANISTIHRALSQDLRLHTSLQNIWCTALSWEWSNKSWTPIFHWPCIKPFIYHHFNCFDAYGPMACNSRGILRLLCMPMEAVRACVVRTRLSIPLKTPPSVVLADTMYDYGC